MRVTSRSVLIEQPPAPPAGIGLEAAAAAHRVMKSGSDRPDGDAEDLGNRVERQVEVVVQDHHGSMVDATAGGSRARAGRDRRRAQAPSASGSSAGRRRRFGASAGPAALGVAGAHEEPVRPGVEARRVAELRKVPPDGEQRLLRRILGEVGVAQDPVRHRVEAVARGDGEAREGLLVTTLRPSDEFGIHVRSAVGHPTVGHSYGMGVVHTPAAQTSRPGQSPVEPVRTSRTINRYWLFAPTQVWRVMPGRLSDAHAQDAAVVGAVIRHHETRYAWTVPEPSAYQTFMPFFIRPAT
jgi:hypothetical protein